MSDMQLKKENLPIDESAIAIYVIRRTFFVKYLMAGGEADAGVEDGLGGV